VLHITCLVATMLVPKRSSSSFVGFSVHLCVVDMIRQCHT